MNQIGITNKRGEHFIGDTRNVTYMGCIRVSHYKPGLKADGWGCFWRYVNSKTSCANLKGFLLSEISSRGA